MQAGHSSLGGGTANRLESSRVVVSAFAGRLGVGLLLIYLRPAPRNSYLLTGRSSLIMLILPVERHRFIRADRQPPLPVGLLPASYPLQPASSRTVYSTT